MQMSREIILSGKAVLGIEFGSTRIKAVLIAPDNSVLATGDHTWQDQLVDGIWSYSEEAILHGLTDAYMNMKADVEKRYGVKLKKLAALGVSAMMHGYLAFDKQMKLLVPFRTWRNTITEESAAKLTELFQFNIPQRWSLAHLYQAILNGEEHVPAIRHITTLAGYVHYLLTNSIALGIGDAAGVMPIDSEKGTYDENMCSKFQALIQDKGYPWTLKSILPAVLPAGMQAGVLSREGALLLDPTGDLEPGAAVCPPEGDAGTGMVATNAVAVRTGNISAGTSIFAMIVLEKPLSKLYTAIDMVTTPTGKPVAMVHCNSCTSDLNAWVALLADFARAMGVEPDMGKLYTMLFNKAMEGDKDCGGLMSFNYYSGEPVTGTSDGVPMFTRLADAPISLANFMRTLIYSSMATLKIGMNILTEQEKVAIDSVVGHGGLFKTKGVAQGIMASALHTPVTVMETAGEGGAWGIAVLANYMANKAEGETLEAYLNDKVFAGMAAETMQPDSEIAKGFEQFLARYTACLDAEKACVKGMKN